MLPLDVAAGLTRAFLPVWRGKRPDGPIRGVVALTCRCNMRCRYCRSWDKTAGKEWTPNELSRLFRQMPRLVWLDVTGGEIFARRDAQELLVACVESARQLKVFHFATNGFFADRVVEAVRAINRRTPSAPAWRRRRKGQRPKYTFMSTYVTSPSKAQRLSRSRFRALRGFAAPGNTAYADYHPKGRQAHFEQHKSDLLRL